MSKETLNRQISVLNFACCSIKNMSSTTLLLPNSVLFYLNGLQMLSFNLHVPDIALHFKYNIYYCGFQVRLPFKCIWLHVPAFNLQTIMSKYQQEHFPIFENIGDFPSKMLGCIGFSSMHGCAVLTRFWWWNSSVIEHNVRVCMWSQVVLWLAKVVQELCVITNTINKCMFC